MKFRERTSHIYVRRFSRPAADPILRRVARIVILILFVQFSAPPDAIRAQTIPGPDEVVTLLALGPLLQNLRTNLDAVIGTVDTSAAARLRQTQIIIDKAIQDIETIIQRGYEAVARSREEWFKQVFDTLSVSNQIIQQNTRLIALETSKLLVTISTLLDSLPFVRVPNYFVGLDPLRIRHDATDRLVSFYGYFPHTKSRPARIRAKGTVITLDKYSHSVGFEIPTSWIAAEQTYIDMTLQIPRRGFLGIWTWDNFKARLYVEKAEPFTFVVAPRVRNPQYTASVPGVEFRERADSAQTSNNQTMTAAQVFSRTITNTTQYDVNSARFTAVSIRKDDGHRPCDCCTASSAIFDGWNDYQLAFRLSAPTCGQQWCSPTYFCGGGGTHASLFMTPTFTVNRLNQSPDLPIPPLNRVARRNTVITVPLDPTWTSVHLTGHFKDGDDEYTEAANLTLGIPTATTTLWSARVVNGILEIATRQSFGTQASAIAPAILSLQTARISEVPIHKSSSAASPALVAAPPTATFPFVVYSDKDATENHFIPSGVVGDPSDLVVNTGFADDPNCGKTCIELTYSRDGGQYSGRYWQQPRGNWGDIAGGGYDLRGATMLEFWARGQKGGEILSEVRVGGIGQGTKPYPDSAVISKKKIALTNTWGRFQIDLTGADLSRVIGGFYVELSREDNPNGAVVLLDRIAFKQ